MLWLLTLVFIIYIAIKTYSRASFWSRKGIAHVKHLSLFVTFWRYSLGRITIVQLLQTIYNDCPEDKFIGIYNFIRPTLMVKDPNLIKEITIKSFDNFSCHAKFIPKDVEPLLINNLFFLDGPKWKNMRATLSPAFTGSKMRKMYILIKECAEKFTKYFVETEKGVITLQMEDIFTKFTNDIIATCAFGISCDSLKDDKNEFYLVGKQATDFNFKTSLKVCGLTIVPKVMKMFDVGFYPKYVTNFFQNVIKTTIEMRQQGNIIRPDIIHLMMEARKGRLKHDKEEEVNAGFATVEESDIGKEESNIKSDLTDDDITAQAFLFFLAGYQTGSNVMSFIAYELAVNPNVQKKLQEEIDAALEATNNNIDYTSLQQMKYLDMVVSETLRKWPSSVFIERICTRDYETSNGNQSFVFEKGMQVWMPVYCLHHDEQYFPDPEKFDPERFSDENKKRIQPFTYLPFGAGPRNCIGSRFVLLEMKTLFVNLLSKFDIVVVEKTQVPIKLSKFVMKSEKGIWLGFKLRQMHNKKIL